MIYRDWFAGGVPAGWQLLAVLRGAHPGVTNGGRQVSFYATSPDAVPAAMAALRRFASAVEPAAHVALMLP